MNNLPKVVTQLCPEYDLNPRPVDCKSNTLPVMPPRHLIKGVIKGKKKSKRKDTER